MANQIFQCVGGEGSLVDAETGSCASGWWVYTDFANFVANDPAQVVAGVVAYCSDSANACESGYGYPSGGSASVVPELSLEDGGLIAGAILALWATAFCLRALRQQLQED